MLAALAIFCHARAWLVVTTALLLTAGCMQFIVSHMAVSTDFDALLSHKLPFVRNHAALEKAFPRHNDTVLVVIDGDTADVSAFAARTFTAWLSRHPDVANQFFDPGGSTFFQRNGLLYLSPDELDAVSGRLVAMQPVLAQLARNATLAGMAKLIGDALEHDMSIAPDERTTLARMFDAWRAAITAVEQHRFFIFPWRDIMAGNAHVIASHRRIIEITPHMDTDAIQPAAQAIEAIQKAIPALGLTLEHGVRVRLTGSAMLDYVQLQGSLRAAGLATALAGALILLLLFMALKSVRMLLAVTLTLVMSLIWTTAFALCATAPLNVISASFAVLFIGMGVDFGIQFGMHCQRQSLRDTCAIAAIRHTAAGQGAAMTVSATAAAAGFLAFTPTAYKGLADLGIIAGGGMLLALAATLTVLPALMGMMHLPDTPYPVGASFDASEDGDSGEGHLAAWIAAHARFITGAAIAIACIAFLPATYLTFDFNPLHLLDAGEPAVKTFKDLARESKASPYAIEIMTRDGDSAEKLAESLRHQDSVARVVTLTSLVPDHQVEKLAAIEDLTMLLPPFTLNVARHTASGPAVITAALTRTVRILDTYSHSHANNPLAPHADALSRGISDFLHRSGRASGMPLALEKTLMQGLIRQINLLAVSLTPETITVDQLPRSLKQRFLAPGGSRLIQVYSKLNLDDPGNMERFVRQVQRLAPQASGDPVMMVAGGHAVALAFRQASAIAFVIVAILLAFSLKSIRYCIGVLVPLLLATLLTAAIMEIFSISLNLANVIVAPLLAGLGVSYGIYMALRQRMEGMDGLFASATPQAILFSALTTLCSFGSMAISGDTAMTSLGVTLTIALSVVLVCVLIIQPALLSLSSPFIPGRPGNPCANVYPPSPARQAAPEK